MERKTNLALAPPLFLWAKSSLATLLKELHLILQLLLIQHWFAWHQHYNYAQLQALQVSGCHVWT